MEENIYTFFSDDDRVAVWIVATRGGEAQDRLAAFLDRPRLLAVDGVVRQVEVDRTTARVSTITNHIRPMVEKMKTRGHAVIVVYDIAKIATRVYMGDADKPTQAMSN